MQQIYTGLLQLLIKFNNRGIRFKPARKRASRRVWYLEKLRFFVREIIQIRIGFLKKNKTRTVIVM